MSSTSERVVIGMDPHKRSATIEVMSADETIVGAGRFGTDRDGGEGDGTFHSVSWRRQAST